ncbi:riboflavin biosynthesis protein RibD [Lewinellaceae bacterium SD302]|nr:riboflavin biosynthesis protein RibD [Lewinellaceae bacterium SD302]
MHEHFLQRCCDLALLPSAAVSPNPRVGAVLVHRGRIIGEGYHKKHGSAHAEVNCLASVRPEDRHLITDSTIYVSLEPCCIFGRTPPCTNLIIEHKIPRVVVGQRDRTAEVSGRGIQLLLEAGVEVKEFPDFKPAATIAQPRQLFAAKQRPFVLLKYARSADGFLAPADQKSYWITGLVSRRLVHFWRARTKAILIGAGTLLADDPRLNLRYYPGEDPLAVIVDPKGKVKGKNFRLLERRGDLKPILIQPLGAGENLAFEQHFVNFGYQTRPARRQVGRGSSVGNEYDPQFINDILAILHAKNFNHITVEGGGWLLKKFFASQQWDEARVFTQSGLVYGAGVRAPLPLGRLADQEKIQNDLLQRFYPD